MLRKRSRSNQKDQETSHQTMSGSGSESFFQSDVLGNRNRNTSFFSVPGFFLGLNAKGYSDSDSVRSPKSPLDFRVFSNFGSPFRSPLSPTNGHQKNWEYDKVGLGIVDSLCDDAKVAGEVLRSSSDGKTILFGPQMRIRTPSCETHVDSFEAAKSLPKNYMLSPLTQMKSPINKGITDVVFEIGETPFEAEPLGKFLSCSLDSCRSFLAVPGLSNSNSDSWAKFASQASSRSPVIQESPNLNSFSPTTNGPPELLSASEIELSEDYTCVISHGPIPKTTHIYGDCVFKCDNNVLSSAVENEKKKIESPPVDKNSITLYPSNAFLSFCYSCNKKLEEGKDIYIYRGDKAFCSLNCRSQKILIDEEMEKAMEESSDNSPQVEDDEEKL
ncbi:hypothetical protein SLA2020_005460 [Shorea laevis]